MEIVTGGKFIFAHANRGGLGATLNPGMRRIRVTRPNARSVRFHVPAKLVFGGRRPWGVLTSYIGGTRCPKRGNRPDTQKCVHKLRSS